MTMLRREDVKAAIEKLHADVRSQLMAEDDSYCQAMLKRRLRGIEQSLEIIAALPAAEPEQAEGVLTTCQAGLDCECTHRLCPQNRDNEPFATGRSCPLPHFTDDPEY